MTDALKSIGAITLFVEDVDRAKSWYGRTFGLPFVHEDDDSAVIKFDHTLINLLRAGAATGLIAPARVAGSTSGARFQLTIWVDDVDAVCADLAQRGVSLVNGPIDREWGVRTACFADPDGHLWEIAQPL